MGEPTEMKVISSNSNHSSRRVCACCPFGSRDSMMQFIMQFMMQLLIATYSCKGSNALSEMMYSSQNTY